MTNIDSNKCTYSEILFQISEKQKELLIILAKAGKARAVTSGKYHLLSTSSVHSALRGCWRRILLPKSRAYTRCTTAFWEEADGECLNSDTIGIKFIFSFF